MFDLRISSPECTFILPNGRIVRTIASYCIEERMIYFGNWFNGNDTLRAEDDAVRESEPEFAALAPLFHEIVHDALHQIGESGNFDSLFYDERLEDELGMPDWKPCLYCGSKMSSPMNSSVCRRCHMEETGWFSN